MAGQRPPGGPGGHFMTEEEKANRPKVTVALVKRVFSYLRPYWKQMTLVILLIALSSTLGILPSVLTGKIVDDGLIGRDLRMLVILIVASLALTLGSNLIGVAEAYLNTWITTFESGISLKSVSTLPIFLTTSMPFLTLPNTACFPSSQGVASRVIKNCEPPVLGPALAMDNIPSELCFKSLLNSSSIV